MEPGLIAALVVVGLLVVVVFVIIGIYNGLVAKRIACDEGWAQIDTQLTRRHDLIPNLVETVKGYASHERETLEAVVKARQQAVDASGVEDQAAAENFLTGALGKLFALAEAYPDLKANQNFLQLQGELSETEDKIAHAREYYNGQVRVYNTAAQQFPANVIAGMFSFKPREFFEVEDESVREVPKVSF